MVARSDALTAASGLSYRRAGTGQPLVLVHGYLGGSAQWQAEIDRFSAGYDVIAPDLPGFAASAGCNPVDRIEGFVAAIIGLLDELGVTTFMLMGHSMGGMIAQEMAARHGDRVTRLVLYGTGPLGVMPDRFETLDISRQRLRADGVAETTRRIGATWFRDGEQATGFGLVAALGAQASEAAAMGALDAMDHWDGRPAIPTLTMPSLVIWGDGDKSYRWPQTEALWRALPDAGLAVLPRAAHAAHLEKPGIFQAMLGEFLAG
ncbi:MAG: alpha/beta hydrolase [Albidovulum sp.]|uniref:alpha/beta fold hydrolase n=1 Tax=Albidovulum sp. TaxID=1872424 RepID=UPI003CADB6A4